MNHKFTPATYYTTLGPHEPVLRVADGDTIVTTTVDAGGCDHSRERVTPSGNPQTGPFFVEGAEAGDTPTGTPVSLRALMAASRFTGAEARGSIRRASFGSSVVTLDSLGFSN